MADNELTLAMAALNINQREFVRLYQGKHRGNGRESYREAYGCKKTDKVLDAAASRLLTNVKVIRAFAAMEQPETQEAVELAEENRARILRIARNQEDKQPAVALRATEQLGKICGQFQADAPQDSKAIEIEESMRAELEEFAAWRIRQGLKQA